MISIIIPVYNSENTIETLGYSNLVKRKIIPTLKNKIRKINFCIC